MEQFSPVRPLQAPRSPRGRRIPGRGQPARGERAPALPRGAGAGAGPHRVPLPAGGAGGAIPRMPAFFEMLARLRLPDGQLLAGRGLHAGDRGGAARARHRPAGAGRGAEGAGGRSGAAPLGQHVAALHGRRGLARPDRRGGPGRQRRLRPSDPRDHRGRGDGGRGPDHRLHGPRARHRLRLRPRRLRRRRYRLPLLPRLPLRHGQDRRRLRARRARGAATRRCWSSAWPASRATSR